MPTPGVSIFTTVVSGSDIFAAKSYTLPNTPFYFTPVWANLYNVDESVNFSQYEIVWNFDDGTTFVGPSACYYYKFPGVYKPTATFFDKQGNAYTVTVTYKLSVYNVFPDTVVFDALAPAALEGVYMLPAGKKSEPLKIFRYNSWQHDAFLSQNNYTINLYASGSKSTYYSPTEYYKGRYSHLRNFFGFIETTASTNNTLITRIVDKTTTTSVSVYATPIFDVLNNITFNFDTLSSTGSVFVGTSGSVTTSNKFVSFIDQTPSPAGKNTLIYLFASQDSTGFQDKYTIEKGFKSYLEPTPYSVNNTSWQVQYLKSVFNPAQSISITSNGITVEGDTDTIGPLSSEQINSFSIYPIKWTDSKISFCCIFKDSDNFTTKNYPPITGFRYDGKLPTELNSISLSLVEYQQPEYRTDILQTQNVVEDKAVRIQDAIFEKNQTIPQFENSSYFCGTVKTNTAVHVAAISACALVKDEPILNLGITYGYAGQPGLGNIKRFKKNITMDHCSSENLQFEILATGTNAITTSNNSSIGISVLPMGNYKLGENRVYITDADNDTIKVFNNDGLRLGAIDLRNALVYNGENNLPISVNLLGNLDSASPANIAIDGDGNAWVSLYDSGSCFKFDYTTLTITACAVPPLINVEYVYSDYYTVSGFAGENSLLPACIDTDTQNNVIVGYSHPISGFVIKYDANGNLLKIATIPVNFSIQELIVDSEDNVYGVVKTLLRNKPNPHYVEDFLFKWDSSLNLVNNFPVSIKNIGSATIDMNENIYVSSQASKFTRVTPTGEVTTIDLPAYPVTYLQYIGGIACDEEGFIWIIHNQTGKIYFYPINDLQQLPLSGIFSGDLPDIQLTTSLGSQAIYSVAGDWTGVRWINKYIRETTTTPRYVYGKSNLFAIYENKPVIAKINEDFDQAATLKSYALQESMINKPVLFDDFIGQIVGDYNSLPTDLGKTIYEKIANFVANNSDVDTCELESLRNHYEMVGKDLEQFGVNYPPKLRRIMNLLSIKPSKLLGSPNTFNQNFSRLPYNQDKQNLGEEISIDTGTFIAGEPIISFEKFSEKYKLIYNTIIPLTDGTFCSAGQVCALSGINYNWGWGLVTSDNSVSGASIGQFYRFYKYIPYMPLTPIDSVIDFNSSQNTYTNTQSSYGSWIEYGGGMDVALSRALYEGLNLYD